MIMIHSNFWWEIAFPKLEHGKSLKLIPPALVEVKRQTKAEHSQGISFWQHEQVLYATAFRTIKFKLSKLPIIQGASSFSLTFLYSMCLESHHLHNHLHLRHCSLLLHQRPLHRCQSKSQHFQMLSITFQVKLYYFHGYLLKSVFSSTLS